MNSKNANNYENVVIRKEQEVGINNFGLEYLVSLEEEIERLNNIIKEVREYIENDIKGNYFKRYDDKVYEMCEELLGILDKGE